MEPAWKFLLQLPVSLFVENLLFFKRSFARIDHHVVFEIEYPLEIAQRNVKQVPDAARQSFEEPNVRARGSELDMPQPLAPDFGKRYFHSAFVANDAAMFHPLVLAAQTLPVRDRTENPGAE